MKKIAQEYEKRHPDTKIILDSAGSLVCARKITELKKPCDIIASSDYFVVREILPSEYGMEITIDAGKTFYLDISSDTFKQQPLHELSEVWISFSPEAGIALKGSNG
jgi:hypothetical protein